MDLASDSTAKVLGRLHPREFLTIYPHSSAPCHNLHQNSVTDKVDSVKLFSEVANEFSYKVSYPLPMFPPNVINRQTVNGLDPSLILLNEKKVWDKYKAELLKYCTQAQVERYEKELCTRRNPRVPYNISVLADHMRKDPDKYFHSNYNFYYAGGNISCLEAGGDKYLIWAKADDSGEIFVDQFSLEDTQVTDINSNWIVESNVKGPIYQIESLDNFMVTRHKNKICLFSINGEIENKLQFYKSYEVDNSEPFYYTCLNSKYLCTISASREIEIFDAHVETSLLKSVVDKEEGVHMSDNWCSAHYIDDNTLCFIDRTSISYIDMRVKTDVLSRWTVAHLTEHCEEIYCGAAGSSENEYIVTNHQVLCLDRRIGFLQRWTHGITHSPAFISVLANDLSDKMFIGSQRCSSIVFIENSCKNGNNISLSQPYYLPSTVETLHAARYHGCCLGNTVSSRFFMSTTGLCSVDNGNDMGLFKITSTGDVFNQSLTKGRHGKDISLREDDIVILNEWEQSCEDAFLEQSKVCTVEKILQDKHLVSYVTNASCDYEEPVKKVDNSSAPWRISKKELMRYCDYLAPRMLKEWNIEDLEEWAEDSFEEKAYAGTTSDEDEDVEEAVAKWNEIYAEDETNYSFQQRPSNEMQNSHSEEADDSISTGHKLSDFLLSSSTPLPKPQKLQEAPVSLSKKHAAGF